MGVWQKVKVRLGLEDGWDDLDGEYYDDEPDDVEDGYDAPRQSAYESPYGAGALSVRRVERAPERDHGGSRSLRSVPTGAASVTPVGPQVRIHIVEPKTFGEIQPIADRFKQGTPVLMNLSSTKADVAKRLVDFASGLTYGQDGGLQKVSDRIFLLTPANVDVSAEDRRRLKDGGLFGFEG